MSAFVLTQAVQQYTLNVAHLVQQMQSRLRGTVTVGNYTGKAGVVVEQFASTDAQPVVSRYTPLAPLDIQSDRRWVYPSDWQWTEWVDQFDKLRLLIDPTGPYAQSAAYALNRRIDDVIIAAYFSNANTGENGSTSTQFLPANQVSASEGASGATGLNVAKLKAGIQLLLANEAWDPSSGERIYVPISAKQNRNLMDDPEFTNGDYTSSRGVIEKGWAMGWGQVEFIHTERLPLNGSNQTRVPMYTKQAMHLGIWGDVETDVSQRKDLSSLPWQVYAKMTIGATRVEEKRIVEIPCA